MHKKLLKPLMLIYGSQTNLSHKHLTNENFLGGLSKCGLYIMASLGFIAPPPRILAPPKYRPPLDTEAPGPSLIYLVGPLAILDPHINICVTPPNTCIALKQFNLLPPNTLL